MLISTIGGTLTVVCENDAQYTQAIRIAALFGSIINAQRLSFSLVVMHEYSPAAVRDVLKSSIE